MYRTRSDRTGLAGKNDRLAERISCLQRWERRRRHSGKRHNFTDSITFTKHIWVSSQRMVFPSDIPEEFPYFSYNFHLQGTASEATLVALLGAKAKKIKQVKEQHPDWTESEIISRLIAYCSCEYTAIILSQNLYHGPAKLCTGSVRSKRKQFIAYSNDAFKFMRYARSVKSEYKLFLNQFLPIFIEQRSSVQ